MMASIIRRRRAITVGLLVLAGCISCIDRAALSISNISVMADMHMSYTTMGLLLGIFPWAYLAGQIPMGLLSDRFGSRYLLGIGLLAWSGAQMAFGLMHSVRGLFAARIGLGLGEAPLFLTGTRAIVEWFAPVERGRPIGLFNGSAALGPALAPPILLSIMAVWGWRGMSVTIGAASAVLALVWILYYRDPDEAVRARITPGKPEPGLSAMLRDDLGYLLRQRSTWVATTGFIGVIYVTGLYGTWMPAWLVSTQHLTGGQAGLLSALPQFFGFFGSVLGGAVSDYLGRRGKTPMDACRIPIVITMLIAALATALTTLQAGLTLTIVFMALALFMGGIAMTCAWTLGTIIAADHRVATLEAIQNTGGSLGGALVPAVTGLLADRYHSFTPGVLLASMVGAVCAVTYHYGLRDNSQRIV